MVLVCSAHYKSATGWPSGAIVYCCAATATATVARSHAASRDLNPYFSSHLHRVIKLAVNCIPHALQVRLCLDQLAAWHSRLQGASEEQISSSAIEQGICSSIGA